MSIDDALAAFRDGRHREAHDALLTLQRDPALRLDAAALALLRDLNRVGRRAGVRRHRCLHRLCSRDDAPVVALRFAGGDTALSGTTRGALEVWSLSTGARSGELPGHRGRISAIAVASAAPVVVSVDERRHLRVWDLSTRQCRVHLDHSDYDDDVFKLMTVSHDGARGFSTDGIAQGYHWDLERGWLLGHFDLVTSGAPVQALFTPESRGAVYLEHQDGSWARLDMATDHIEATATPAVLDSTYRAEVVDERVILRDPLPGDELLVLDGHQEPVLSAAIAPSEVMVLSGDAGGEIRVWEVDWELEFD
jgi:WD40 repeat protein